MNQTGCNHPRRGLNCFATKKQDRHLRMFYGFSNRYPLSPNFKIISRECSSTIAYHEQQLRMIHGFFNLFHPTLHILLHEPKHGTETKKARIFRIVSLKKVISELIKSNYTLTSYKLAFEYCWIIDAFIKSNTQLVSFLKGKKIVWE